MEKIVLFLFILSKCLVAAAQDEQSLLLKGNELYKQQQFDKAAEEYRKAAELNAKNPKAQYNLGNALYKSKKPDDAEKSFDVAADNTKDAMSKSKALYNKGVTLSSRQKLPESIDAYKESLRLNSQDEEARQNLQKALNELKKQQQNQQKQQNKQDKQQNQKQPQQQQNNSKLNQKQVEQMLSALRKDEKKLQQDIQKKNNMGRPNAKDW